MTHVFYISSILILFFELRWIFTPFEKTEESKRLLELKNIHKGKDWDDYSKEYKSLVINRSPILFYFLWLFIGMFTFQWPIFLLFLVFNIIIIAPLSEIFKYRLSYTILHWFNSILGFGFTLFVILNKYHLHIDTYEAIKLFLKC
jgi:hypothetical protein